MNKKDCETSLVWQSRAAAKTVKTVYGNMGEENLEKALPKTEIGKIKRVLITGCGDSWLAGIAMKPVFESVAKLETEAWRCIEFTRFLDGKRMDSYKDDTLVIGISVSGAVSRVVEAMMRADKHGIRTLAITDNPESPVAKASKATLGVGLPRDIGNGPGSNNYNGSMVGLISIALWIALNQGTISKAEYDEMRKSMLDYVDDFQAKMESYEEPAFQMADIFKDMRAIDFIGDYADYATAFFGSAKVLEAYGGYTTYDDSEDWCHINYFLREPKTIGRVVITNKSTPSYGRMLETLAAVEQLESPCLVVTDADKSEFPESFTVMTTPAPKYFWLNPLMQHFAFDLVCGYIQGLTKIQDFRRDMPEYDIPGLTGNSRIRESKIEVL